MNPFKILVAGDWPQGKVRLQRRPESTRRIVPEVERIIDQTWARVVSDAGREGVKLFDGPMCRIESFDARPEEFQLVVSPTTYKPFVGTNLYNQHLAERFGRDVFSNPIGVSTLLQTADDLLMLGWRNASVAYYPNRVHPFAGTIDPEDGDDPFNAVKRELAEELNLANADIAAVRCIGLAEDNSLMQPEMIFLAQTSLTKAAVDPRVDPAEHHATWSVSADCVAVTNAMHDAALTPIGAASLMLWLDAPPLVGR